MRKKSYTSIIYILLIVLCTYLGYRLISFGSVFRDCQYTEEFRIIPANLENISLVLDKDAYVATGKNPEHCTSSFLDINNEIINSEAIENMTVGKRYFENQDRNIKQLSKGNIFSLEKIIAQTKHGIGTIDSGPGPIYYFILKDINGDIYEIATIALGYDEKDSFLSVSKDGNIVAPLSVKYLKQFNLSI